VESTPANLNYPIIVHCHLGWDGVWQRPQQFISRLSQRHPVLFYEAPTRAPGNAPPSYTLCPAPGYPNVTVLRTELPEARFGDTEWVDSQRHRILQRVLQGPLAGRFDHPVQWFYDPMAAPVFCGRMNERAIVYDCMDELSQFRFAPPDIVRRERILLERADVVFAGGRRMAESKRRYHNNVHFYGCGVDVAHFSKAREPGTIVPPEVAGLPGPVLGYFGVVDERIDYELLEKMADAHPDWNIVMVGPLAKVDPALLPQRPRLHWLGRRDYKELPALTKGFDVCLMPFALNAATEFINPTKALEYMATGKPIVSSAVPDVVSNFSEVVRIGRSHDAFIDFCTAALTQPDRRTIERGLQMAGENQWDAIVARLEEHLDAALAARAAAPEGVSWTAADEKDLLSTA
jgi:glycosyltransferase involved in cell wall biosynthesis